ncbi:acyltransferase family protein [Lacrimispora sp. 38-1]|uniref:acyltransferase family protein n=1 Tax=Lacrimispora sp. 38-1 TaxID=3125778 RepID=UPI003CEBFE29
MGIYRFILSIVVILFHFGNFSQPSGYSAVFGFYILSGYLITLVIDKTYYMKGIKSFYINRFLKLYPLYILYLILTYVLVMLHGGCGLALDLNNSSDLFYALPQKIETYKFVDMFNEMFLNFFANKIPIKTLILTGFPQLVPQAWSLTVEIIFYISAPFLVYLYKIKKVGKLLFFALIPLMLIYPISTLINGLDFPVYRYRSVFSTFVLFLIGSAIYFIKRKIPEIKKSNIIFFALIGIYLILIIFVNRNKIVESQIYIALTIQILIVVFATQISLKGKLAKYDKILGRLTYGLFIGHSFTGFLVLIITEHFYLVKGKYVFGRPYTLIFGLFVAGLQIIISIITYHFIEKPIESIRTKVRGKNDNVKDVIASSHN